jgi:hypothetical protein
VITQILYGLRLAPQLVLVKPTDLAFFEAFPDFSALSLALDRPPQIISKEGLPNKRQAVRVRLGSR